MRGWLIAAASAAALVSGAPGALAQSRIGPATRPAPTPTTAKAFIDAAASADALEIASSRLALSRSKSQPIRDFATHMIDEHTMTTNALMAAVQLENLPPPASPSGDSQKGAMMDALTQASLGSEFDDRYIALQRQAHQDALALHRNYAANGDNAALRDLAADTSARIADHLAMANSLRR
jgi:putative membrane protein